MCHLIKKINNRKKKPDDTLRTVPIVYLCGRMKKGCPQGAEIIPYEPDPDSAGGGIGFQNNGASFFIWIKL